MNRRDFLKSALTVAVCSPLAGVLARAASGSGTVSEPVVYFTPEISPEAVVRMYRVLGVALPGPVAVKVHSGEKGNQNFLRPEFFRPMVEAVNGTIVECNTAYEGARNTTEKHRRLIAEHGWSSCFPVDLMDAEGPDLVLPVPGGRILKQNFVGKNMARYRSMLVLSHFKGHPVAGYGGALKQLSIGCASSRGKALIHSGGVTADQTACWNHMASAEVFGDAMAETAGTIVNYSLPSHNSLKSSF